MAAAAAAPGALLLAPDRLQGAGVCGRPRGEGTGRQDLAAYQGAARSKLRLTQRLISLHSTPKHSGSSCQAVELCGCVCGCWGWLPAELQDQSGENVRDNGVCARFSGCKRAAKPEQLCGTSDGAASLARKEGRGDCCAVSALLRSAMPA